MSTLNPKQARFVAEYLIDSNATQAAIRAGYSKRTANEQGARLLANVSVRAAVDAGRAKLTTDLGITAQSLIRDVVAIGNEAREGGVFAAALKSREMLGKSLGKDNPFGDPPPVEPADNAILNPPSLHEIARGLAFLLTSAQRRQQENRLAVSQTQATATAISVT